MTQQEVGYKVIKYFCNFFLILWVLCQGTPDLLDALINFFNYR